MVDELILKLKNTDEPHGEIKLADEILKTNPQDVNVILTKAYAQLKLNLLNDAINTFEDVFEYDSTNSLANNGIGVSYANLGEFEKAYEYFNKAYESDKNINIVLNLANILKQLKRKDEAREKFREVLELDPDNIQAKFEVRNDLEFSSIEEGLKLAEDYHQKNDLKKAIEIYSQITDIQKDCIPAFNNQGLIYEELNDTKNAIKSYKKAIEFDSKAEASYINLAHLYLKEAEFIKASNNFKKALEINSKNETTLANYAFCLIQLKKFKKAIKISQKSLEINPNQLGVYVNLAWCYESTNKFKKAIKTYDEAIKIFPNEVILLNNKAWACENINKLDEALKCYDKAIEIEPENGEFLIKKARIYKKQGLMDLSRKTYVEGLKISPEIRESFEDL